MTTRRTLNVSGLPTVVFGQRTMLWWATIGLAIIEGSFFAMLAFGYFYLRIRVDEWPPGVLPPYLLWGTINTAIFVLSMLPNMWLKKVAEKGDLRKVKTGLLVISGIGLVTLLLRVFEFPALGVRWDANAYGSMVFAILGFHTAHLLTDWIDTVVLTVLLHTDRVEGQRFMDVYENCDYWTFVIVLWAPVYFIVYWAPRWI